MIRLNIKEYMEAIKRTRPNLENDFTNQLHMVIGASTESGELLDAYKKKLAYNKDLDEINIGEEIGDIFWYLFNLCDYLGFEPEYLMWLNVRKLKIRFPDKFDEEKANNRDLLHERKILEGS